MNNIIIALTLGLLLVGCTTDGSDSLYDTLTERTDATSQLTLLPSKDVYASFDDIVAAYHTTMACVGLVADGPTIKYVSYKTDFNGAYGAPWAGYISPGHIFVNTDLHDRDARTDREALTHEYIHHILDHNDSQHGHSGNEALFAQCGVGVNTFN